MKRLFLFLVLMLCILKINSQSAWLFNHGDSLCWQPGQNITVSFEKDPSGFYWQNIYNDMLDVVRMPIFAGDSIRFVDTPYMQADKKWVEVGNYENQRFEIKIKTNISSIGSITCKPQSSWLTLVSSTDKYPVYIYTFECALNNLEKDRETNISFTFGDQKETVKVLSICKKNTIVREHEALIAFYNATGGENWFNNSNWNTTKPIDTWFGVSVKDGYVSEIILNGNNLVGYLPKEIGNLGNLKNLTIYDSHLDHGIPPELGNLANLEHLRLANNDLTGIIPSELGNLKQLVDLDLCNNQLSGEIPESFNNLTGLIYNDQENNKYIYRIDTWNNDLSGKIPSIFTDSPAWPEEWVNLLKGNRRYDLKDIYIPAPTFHVTDIDGNILDSKDYYPNNKLTAIFQWATWCGFSEALMREMIPLYEQYKDHGLEVVGLIWNEEEPVVREYINNNHIPWKNFISSEENMMDYHSSFIGLGGGFPSNSIPEISLVDVDGRVVFTDIIDERSSISEFIKDRLGEGTKTETYTSTDFSADGTVKTLQTATTTKDIKVVIMGDGFTDRDIANGKYDQNMQEAMEGFFSTEPIKSYRDCFTLKSVTAVSENEYFGDSYHTAFDTSYGEGTHIDGNNKKVLDYAKKAISEDDIDNAVIIVVLNDSRNAGTCYYYTPETENNWGGGTSIAYVPNIGYNGMMAYSSFASLVTHEAVGHGFAKLGDEYVEKFVSIPVGERDSYQKDEVYGWWKNVDFTNDPFEVKWRNFIADNRYASEGIGVYEGGLTYRNDVYRPSTVSVMSSDATHFNAPSRQAIWYRINKLIQGKDWEGTYDDFVEFDMQTFKTNANTRSTEPDRTRVDRTLLRPTPPIVKNITWRMEK